MLRCVGDAFGKDDIAIIACNTAHILLPALAQATPAQYVSLIDITVGVCRDKRYKTVGVIGTPITAKRGLYANALLQLGIQSITPSRTAVGHIEALIRNLIAGNQVNPKQLHIVINQLTAVGAESVILGCSELSIIADISRPYILDPITIAATTILEKDVYDA